MTYLARLLSTSLLSLVLVPVACSSDDEGAPAGGTGGSGGRSPDQTGQSCDTAQDCYPDLIDGGAIQGAVTCMDRVQDGYCTHECQVDTDCCAVTGECISDFPQVCSPFESTGKKFCFLSCEEADIRAHENQLFRDGGAIDANLFCRTRANPDFGCRSTGGGRDNRQVCMPGGAAPDASVPDAAAP